MKGDGHVSLNESRDKLPGCWLALDGVSQRTKQPV
jgi:hypothetical protein